MLERTTGSSLILALSHFWLRGLAERKDSRGRGRVPDGGVAVDSKLDDELGDDAEETVLGVVGGGLRDEN